MSAKSLTWTRRHCLLPGHFCCGFQRRMRSLLRITIAAGSIVDYGNQLFEGLAAGVYKFKTDGPLATFLV